jgi:restriction system protein
MQFTAKQRALVQAAIVESNAVLQREYDAFIAQHLSAVDEGEAQLRSLMAVWKGKQAAWVKERKAEIARIQGVLEMLDSLDIEAIASEVTQHLPLPRWVPNSFEMKFDGTTRILILEHEYPNIEAIEWVKRVELKRSVSSRSANKSETKQASATLYPALTLLLAVSLADQLPSSEVDAIVVNGWVHYRSKATGELQRAYCAALVAKPGRLKEIDLQFVDPATAFAALKGNASRSLELTPIAPKLRMDMSDSRFVDPKAVLSNLTDGENLASMDWEDFEHLCRELFERVFASAGATVSVTQASRDQGVDAIIIDPDLIRGGKMVIQAKRYVNTVDVSAVRDLWGTVSHEGAMKGLLVTTSQFGPDAYAFAQDKPITLINGSELLYLLEQNGYTFRIDLEEARKFQRETGAPSFQRRGRPERA